MTLDDISAKLDALADRLMAYIHAQKEGVTETDFGNPRGRP